VARLAEALGLDAAARADLVAAGGRLPQATPNVPMAAPAEPVVSAPPRPSEPSSAPAAPPTQERRWVTALVARLSGFAALEHELDPEDVHLLAHRCAEGLSDEIRRLGGTVTSFTGETLLAVFGAPVAHEDDSERAVRAGLALRERELLPSDDPLASRLEIRIGINTGEAMAGILGPAERRDYTVLGSTVSAAAALVSRALPRSVLVGEETYRATRERVRYRERPLILEPGREQPLPAWEALNVAPLPHPRSLGTAPLVGREQELDVLASIWNRVVHEARPHLVSVLGEPGIGKSRLIVEFERRAAVQADVLVLHGRCLPYGEVSGYWALAAALREAAGVGTDEASDTARAKLSQLVSGVVGADLAEGDARELERQVALVSGLDTSADRTPVPPDERTVQASVRRLLEALAVRQPVLLLIEDAHWAGEALLNLLEFVSARARGVRLLIITQARPELLDRRPTWGGGVRAFTSLSLEPLDEAAAQALARALCRERGLSESMAEQLGRVAGGNPLYAEELSAMLAEGRQAGGVPSALRALISARLDALPADERLTIKRAAVVGRRVWQDSLAALGLDGDLSERLDALAQRDLLRLQPSSRIRGSREFAFKHDLIREVAYSQLPRTERRLLHGQVADWLEGALGGRADDMLDLLAHHAVEAEQHGRALDYLARSAERARQAAAHREEAALLAQAIAIAERSGRTDLVAEFHAQRGRAFARSALWADARRELEVALSSLAPDRHAERAGLLVDLASACNWLLDTPGTRDNAGRALELAETLGRADLAMGARFWLAWATGADGHLGSALDQYADALDRSERLDLPLAPRVLPLYATTLCWADRFLIAVERARVAVDVARQASDTDSRILGLQVLGLALAGTGRYDEAWHTFQEALQFGRDYGIGPFLARSIAMSAGFHLDVFDYAGHVALVEEARELARSVKFTPALISASIDLLLNLARRGEVGRAEQVAEAVADDIARGASWHGWLWRLRFAQGRAEIALARGDAEQVVRLSTDVLEQSQGRRPKYQTLGLLTRARGLARLGRARSAIADLQSALEVSRSIGDPALFLEVATTLLRLDGADGLADEARSTAAQILARLPTEPMRQQFRRAETVRALGPLGAD
jgi:class 3 adenylate cyclase/tetratricopeptide (TPR) repeat protein